MARNFSDWIENYVAIMTPRGEAPEKFHFWTAASTIAGVLRRRVWIDQGSFRWFPHMYVILVGPPGTVKKSSTINIGMRMLRDVPNIQFGADCTTWQEFVQHLEEAKDVFAEGASPGFKIDLMNQNHTVTSAITVALSEFGTFFNPLDKEMVNVLTEFWDGKVDTPWQKSTKTQGDNTIMNPFVNIIAGTTPMWLRDNFRGHFGGWGLSSRIIFIYCDKPERFIAYPHKLWSGEYDRKAAAFTADLCEISRLSGEYTMSPDAEAYGEKWYTVHGNRCSLLSQHPDADPWLAYYLARKWDHINKLALVLACARGDKAVISLIDLRDAIARCDEIENELSMVFGTQQQASRQAKLNMSVWNYIRDKIKETDGLPERLVYGYTMSFMTFRDAQNMIGHLLAAGWLKREQDISGVTLVLGPTAIQNEAKAAAEAGGETISLALAEPSPEPSPLIPTSRADRFLA